MSNSNKKVFGKDKALNSPVEPQPIVKWAGGKRWLGVNIAKIKPQKWKGRYYEPFVGGGAIFFALKPKKATLSDKNADLIVTYQAVAEDADSVVRLLRLDSPLECTSESVKLLP